MRIIGAISHSQVMRGASELHQQSSDSILSRSTAKLNMSKRAMSTNGGGGFDGSLRPRFVRCPLTLQISCELASKKARVHANSSALETTRPSTKQPWHPLLYLLKADDKHIWRIAAFSIAMLVVSIQPLPQLLRTVKLPP